MAIAHVNRIGTAVPPFNVHQTFVDFVADSLPDERTRHLLQRMMKRAGIEHRYFYLRPRDQLDHAADSEGFYQRGSFPGTAARMSRFGHHALDLARKAMGALDIVHEADSISHLVLASCKGFTAPGLDQRLVEVLGIDASIERPAIGFMGCAAAVNALKVAHHIIRSEPAARVLVLNLELCTLHMQDTAELDKVLSALLFSDGCTAALVSGEPTGITLIDFKVATIPDTQDLITWSVGDTGFEMHLSGGVPSQISHALDREAVRNDSGILRGMRPKEVDLWAVHAGGRTILDAVEQGL
jgi:predicted naringenin-chalcone synthase